MTRKIRIIIAIFGLLAVIGGLGYWFYEQKRGGMSRATKAEQAKVQYTCPMHPFIVKDSPGTCPICGMQLVPKAGGHDHGEISPAVAQVALSPAQQVIANVATTEVQAMPLSREVAAVGIVAYDQSRQAKVTSWVAGRLDRLYVDKVGDYVSAGKPVASVYSPDLVAAQQEYLLALRSREQFGRSSIEAIAASGDGLVSSARQRLKLLGVRDEQIARLDKGQEPEIRLNVYTPVSGVVVEKLAQQGEYVNPGTPLFGVADLSTVWVELEVYESDLSAVRVGQRVEITSPAYPGRTFAGSVTYIYPFLDPKTRTVKVRVSLPNPGTKLKPEMFVNATVKTPLARSLAVPVTAVIDTGKRQVAWVEKEPGKFEPRDVKIGARSGDLVQILSGLHAGEKVATTGAYLIDSEAQLSGGGSQDHSQHTGQPPAAQQQAPGKKKDSLNMDDMKM